ncbi:MAG: hypothetical protein ACPL06_03715 [Candidatus Anstonellales archaeon]
MDLDELIAQYEEIHRNAKKVEVVLPPTEVSKIFDDAPEDLINLDYADLINIYKKVQKVIEIKQKFQTYEVPETRVSIEAVEKPEVKMVEEIPVARPPPKKPAELPPPPPAKEEERKEEVLKLPEEKIKKPEVPIFPKGEEMEEEEKKLEVAIPYIDSHEEVVIEMPKQLSVPVDEAAKRKMEGIVKRYQQAGEINKSDVKRKMIELTRELFKEKSAERKAELKAEIVELKKVIEQKEAGRKSEGFFEAVVKEQDEDLNNIFSWILTTFNTNFDKINNEYQQAKLVIFDDPAMSAKADSLFSSDLESIVLQMTRIIDAYSDYTTKVHVAELEHLKGFGGVDTEKIGKRIEYVRLNYPLKFDELKRNIASTVSKAKPSAVAAPPSAQVREEKKVAVPPAEPRPPVYAPQAEKKEAAGGEAKNVLDEIGRMHEGELLHYLSSRDRRVFISYVRGEISKEEAVKQARILLAKERGVSDTLIKTYWS